MQVRILAYNHSPSLSDLDKLKLNQFDKIVKKAIEK